METFFLGWIILIFVIGALCVTAVLLLFLRFCVHKLFEHGLKPLRFTPDFWIWKACRAYAKTNPPPPQSQVYSPEEKLRRGLAGIIDLADEEGYVITIHTQPIGSPAIGRHLMVYDVREARSRYKLHEEKL